MHMRTTAGYAVVLAAAGLAISAVFSPTLAATPPGTAGFFDLTSSYLLKTAVNYDAGTITATETIKVKNDGLVPANYLNLSVMPHAFGEFTMTADPMVDGVDCDSTMSYYTNNVNLIVPTPALLSGAESTIVLSFVVRPSSRTANDLDQRTSRANGIMQAAQWFPIISTGHGLVAVGDGQVTKAAKDIAFDVTLNRPMPLAAPGNLVSHVGNEYVYDLPHARDYAFSVSPSYRVASGATNGITVRVYYTTGAGKTALTWALRALKTYIANYGPYAWSTYLVAQAPKTNVGDEWPAMTTIGASYMRSAYVVVHEVAHEWWYAMVGDDQIVAPWLDEGFAEFSGRYFFGGGFAYSSKLAIRLPATYWKTSTCAPNGYCQTSYYKAATMLNALRLKMGKTNFFNAMRDIQKTYAFGIVTTANVIAVFERHGNRKSIDAILHAYGAM
jgi:hypothetical protein